MKWYYAALAALAAWNLYAWHAFDWAPHLFMAGFVLGALTIMIVVDRAVEPTKRDRTDETTHD